MKTLLEVLQSGTDYLARQGCDEARATMQHLMAHVLHCNRTALYSRFDRPVEEAELAPLRELLKRRAAGEPYLPPEPAPAGGEEDEEMRYRAAAALCRSTREMAAMLRTSQSTVVRKLKKYGLHPSGA